MTEVKSELTTAVSLMRMALALLDRADAPLAAARLQHAIDIATDAPIPILSPDALDHLTVM